MTKHNSNRKYSTYGPTVSSKSHQQYDKNFQKNIPSNYGYSSNTGFLQTVKEGFGLGLGSTIGQLMVYNILGFPKVNIQHSSIDDDNKNMKNCNEMLMELDKCKENNCNFDKIEQLKNEYHKCKSKTP